MGLSAGQARLLTITARKSNCEYQSMQLSHQKLAISRSLEDVSNEYQNSLEQTKLVYDFYGTGSTNTQLSYGLLMTPSELNEYLPNLLTNSSGKVVLDSQYAKAAEAAGIPKEGLSGLPSDTVRNAFIMGLASSGIITESRASTFTQTAYNQLAGLGSITTTAITTGEMSYQNLLDTLSSLDYTVDPTSTVYNSDYVRAVKLYNGSTETTDKVTLGDILKGNYTLMAEGNDEWNGALVNTGGAVDAVCNSDFWDVMFDSIDALLDTGDAYTQEALAYARSEIEYLISNQAENNPTTPEKGMDEGKSWADNTEQHENFAKWNGGNKQKKDRWVINTTLGYSNNDKSGYIGLCGVFNCGKGDDDDSDISAISVNLSNIANAYLTYFAQKMEGLATSSYSVGATKNTSNLIDDNYTFTINASEGITEDELRYINFYDTLLNQLCTRGWTENDNINDNDYLQEMLQNGMMYLTKAKDDGYYYQGNYATDSYIKTVEDETAIAQAEAKYTTEKQRLSSKEDTLDLKMKNLDTEISSLTTEYDSVKNTITKNIERTFKRYNA